MFGVFFIFLIAVILFLMYKQWEEQSDVPVTKTVEMGRLDQSDTKSLDSIDSVAHAIKSNEGNKTVQGWSPMGDAATAEKIKSWFAARGNYSFYGPEAYSEYQNYDVETLTKLGNSGDVKALHVLADRTEDFQDKKSILYKAAIYGSTDALSRIAVIRNIEKRDSSKSIEDKKAILFEILAYQDVAEKRGDWWPNIQMKDYYLKQYQIKLTAQDNASIKAIADEIYSQMQKHRRDLGLGDFDDSVPDEVIRFYEEMIKPL